MATHAAPKTTKQVEDLETWENVTASRFIIKKFGAKGDLIDEMIGAKRKFHVTTQERQINMEIAANDELDPFSNGCMAPVRLLDTTDDAEQIASNPNLLSESEMATLLKGNVKNLQERVAAINNPALLERLQEMAVTGDVTIGKANAIKSRLKEVAPSLYNEVTSSIETA